MKMNMPNVCFRVNNGRFFIFFGKFGDEAIQLSNGSVAI